MIQVQQNINIPSFSKEDLHYHSMSESKKNAESEASTLDVPFELPITQVVAHTEKLKSPCMPSQNTPSTPSSFKVSRSDASESSHDTNPSSIEQHDLPADEEHSEEGGPTHIQENAQSTALSQPTNNPQTTSQTSHSIQVTVDTSAFASQSQSNGAQRSPSPTSHAPHVPEIKPSSRVLNNLISEDRPTGSRRHTLPIGGSIEQSRASFDIATGTATGNYFANRTSISSVASANRTSFQSVRQLKPSRNTFPAYNSEPDVLKVRNSLVAKRSKKKRRGDLDDDKVLVGNKISEGHENFVMAYNMLTGIRVAVSRCSGVMQKLSDADFNSSKKLSFNMDGSELTPSSKYDFKFKDYCPEVFREMRSMFGLDPADYLVSITGKYILSELGSPGKSGSFFYYSRDFRFIIKTIHHSEHKQLRRILKDYYNHVKENPNTLISQFYGLHRVKMPFSRQGGGSRKVHFVVMNNLFPPHRDIHLKYDLKGSTWGRITKTAEGEDISQTTLKDLNWLERKETIKFGPEKKKLFFEQLERDVKLLKKINVMDYSLLLGVHDVKRGNTFDLSTKLSVFDPKSSNKSELIKTNPRGIDPELDLPSNVFPGRSQYVFYGHDGGIRSTGEQNEPLQQIYYLGIIDCLTSYSTKKRLETFWRSMFHTRSTISAIPAKEYGDRFMKFIKKGTV